MAVDSINDTEVQGNISEQSYAYNKKKIALILLCIVAAVAIYAVAVYAYQVQSLAIALASCTAIAVMLFSAFSYALYKKFFSKETKDIKLYQTAEAALEVLEEDCSLDKLKHVLLATSSEVLEEVCRKISQPKREGAHSLLERVIYTQDPERVGEALKTMFAAGGAGASIPLQNGISLYVTRAVMSGRFEKIQAILNYDPTYVDSISFDGIRHAISQGATPFLSMLKDFHQQIVNGVIDRDARYQKCNPIMSIARTSLISPNEACDMLLRLLHAGYRMSDRDREVLCDLQCDAGKLLEEIVVDHYAQVYASKNALIEEMLENVSNEASLREVCGKMYKEHLQDSVSIICSVIDSLDNNAEIESFLTSAYDQASEEEKLYVKDRIHGIYDYVWALAERGQYSKIRSVFNVIPNVLYTVDEVGKDLVDLVLEKNHEEGIQILKNCHREALEGIMRGDTRYSIGDSVTSIVGIAKISADEACEMLTRYHKFDKKITQYNEWILSKVPEGAKDALAGIFASLSHEGIEGYSESLGTNVRDPAKVRELVRDILSGISNKTLLKEASQKLWKEHSQDSVFVIVKVIEFLNRQAEIENFLKSALEEASEEGRDFIRDPANGIHDYIGGLADRGQYSKIRSIFKYIPSSIYTLCSRDGKDEDLVDIALRQKNAADARMLKECHVEALEGIMQGDAKYDARCYVPRSIVSISKVSMREAYEMLGKLSRFYDGIPESFREFILDNAPADLKEDLYKALEGGNSEGLRRHNVKSLIKDAVKFAYSDSHIGKICEKIWQEHLQDSVFIICKVLSSLNDPDEIESFLRLALERASEREKQFFFNPTHGVHSYILNFIVEAQYSKIETMFKIIPDLLYITHTENGIKKDLVDLILEKRNCEKGAHVLKECHKRALESMMQGDARYKEEYSAYSIINIAKVSADEACGMLCKFFEVNRGIIENAEFILANVPEGAREALEKTFKELRDSENKQQTERVHRAIKSILENISNDSALKETIQKMWKEHLQDSVSIICGVLYSVNNQATIDNFLRLAFTLASEEEKEFVKDPANRIYDYVWGLAERGQYSKIRSLSKVVPGVLYTVCLREERDEDLVDIALRQGSSEHALMLKRCHEAALESLMQGDASDKACYVPRSIVSIAKVSVGEACELLTRYHKFDKKVTRYYGWILSKVPEGAKEALKRTFAEIRDAENAERPNRIKKITEEILKSISNKTLLKEACQKLWKEHSQDSVFVIVKVIEFLNRQAEIENFLKSALEEASEEGRDFIRDPANGIHDYIGGLADRGQYSKIRSIFKYIPSSIYTLCSRDGKDEDLVDIALRQKNAADAKMIKECHVEALEGIMRGDAKYDARCYVPRSIVSISKVSVGEACKMLVKLHEFYKGIPESFRGFILANAPKRAQEALREALMELSHDGIERFNEEGYLPAVSSQSATQTGAEGSLSAVPAQNVTAEGEQDKLKGIIKEILHSTSNDSLLGEVCKKMWKEHLQDSVYIIGKVIDFLDNKAKIDNFLRLAFAQASEEEEKFIENAASGIYRYVWGLAEQGQYPRIVSLSKVIPHSLTTMNFGAEGDEDLMDLALRKNNAVHIRMLKECNIGVLEGMIRGDHKYDPAVAAVNIISITKASIKDGCQMLTKITKAGRGIEEHADWVVSSVQEGARDAIKKTFDLLRDAKTIEQSRRIDSFVRDMLKSASANIPASSLDNICKKIWQEHLQDSVLIISRVVDSLGDQAKIDGFLQSAFAQASEEDMEVIYLSENRDKMSNFVWGLADKGQYSKIRSLSKVVPLWLFPEARGDQAAKKDLVDFTLQSRTENTEILKECHKEVLEGLRQEDARCLKCSVYLSVMALVKISVEEACEMLLKLGRHYNGIPETLVKRILENAPVRAKDPLSRTFKVLREEKAYRKANKATSAALATAILRKIQNDELPSEVCQKMWKEHLQDSVSIIRQVIDSLDNQVKIESFLESAFAQVSEKEMAFVEDRNHGLYDYVWELAEQGKYSKILSISRVIPASLCTTKKVEDKIIGLVDLALDQGKGEHVIALKEYSREVLEKMLAGELKYSRDDSLRYVTSIAKVSVDEACELLVRLCRADKQVIMYAQWILANVSEGAREAVGKTLTSLRNETAVEGANKQRQAANSALMTESSREGTSVDVAEESEAESEDVITTILVNIYNEGKLSAVCQKMWKEHLQDSVSIIGEVVDILDDEAQIEVFLESAFAQVSADERAYVEDQKHGIYGYVIGLAEQGQYSKIRSISKVIPGVLYSINEVGKDLIDLALEKNHEEGIKILKECYKKQAVAREILGTNHQYEIDYQVSAIVKIVGFAPDEIGEILTNLYRQNMINDNLRCRILREVPARAKDAVTRTFEALYKAGAVEKAHELGVMSSGALVAEILENIQNDELLSAACQKMWKEHLQDSILILSRVVDSLGDQAKIDGFLQSAFAQVSADERAYVEDQKHGIYDYVWELAKRGQYSKILSMCRVIPNVLYTVDINDRRNTLIDLALDQGKGNYATALKECSRERLEKMLAGELEYSRDDSLKYVTNIASVSVDEACELLVRLHKADKEVAMYSQWILARVPEGAKEAVKKILASLHKEIVESIIKGEATYKETAAISCVLNIAKVSVDEACELLIKLHQAGKEVAMYSQWILARVPEGAKEALEKTLASIRNEAANKQRQAANSALMTESSREGASVDVAEGRAAESGDVITTILTNIDNEGKLSAACQKMWKEHLQDSVSIISKVIDSLDNQVKIESFLKSAFAQVSADERAYVENRNHGIYDYVRGLAEQGKYSKVGSISKVIPHVLYVTDKAGKDLIDLALEKNHEEGVRLIKEYNEEVVELVIKGEATYKETAAISSIANIARVSVDEACELLIKLYQAGKDITEYSQWILRNVPEGAKEAMEKTFASLRKKGTGVGAPEARKAASSALITTILNDISNGASLDEACKKMCREHLQDSVSIISKVIDSLDYQVKIDSFLKSVFSQASEREKAFISDPLNKMHNYVWKLAEQGQYSKVRSISKVIPSVLGVYKDKKDLIDLALEKNHEEGIYILRECYKEVSAADIPGDDKYAKAMYAIISITRLAKLSIDEACELLVKLHKQGKISDNVGNYILANVPADAKGAIGKTLEALRKAETVEKAKKLREESNSACVKAILENISKDALLSEACKKMWKEHLQDSVSIISKVIDSLDDQAKIESFLKSAFTQTSEREKAYVEDRNHGIYDYVRDLVEQGQYSKIESIFKFIPSAVCTNSSVGNDGKFRDLVDIAIKEGDEYSASALKRCHRKVLEGIMCGDLRYDPTHARYSILGIAKVSVEEACEMLEKLSEAGKDTSEYIDWVLFNAPVKVKDALKETLEGPRNADTAAEVSQAEVSQGGILTALSNIPQAVGNYIPNLSRVAAVFGKIGTFTAAKLANKGKNRAYEQYLRVKATARANAETTLRGLLTPAVKEAFLKSEASTIANIKEKRQALDRKFSLREALAFVGPHITAKVLEEILLNSSEQALKEVCDAILNPGENGDNSIVVVAISNSNPNDVKDLLKVLYGAANGIALEDKVHQVLSDYLFYAVREGFSKNNISGILQHDILYLYELRDGKDLIETALEPAPHALKEANKRLCVGFLKGLHQDIIDGYVKNRPGYRSEENGYSVVSSIAYVSRASASEACDMLRAVVESGYQIDATIKWWLFNHSSEEAHEGFNAVLEGCSRTGSSGFSDDLESEASLSDNDSVAGYSEEDEASLSGYETAQESVDDTTNPENTREESIFNSVASSLAAALDGDSAELDINRGKGVMSNVTDIDASKVKGGRDLDRRVL